MRIVLQVHHDTCDVLRLDIRRDRQSARHVDTRKGEIYNKEVRLTTTQREWLIAIAEELMRWPRSHT